MKTNSRLDCFSGPKGLTPSGISCPSYRAFLLFHSKGWQRTAIMTHAASMSSG
jgi:hypothetical protein